MTRRQAILLTAIAPFGQFVTSGTSSGQFHLDPPSIRLYLGGKRGVAKIEVINDLTNETRTFTAAEIWDALQPEIPR